MTSEVINYASLSGSLMAESGFGGDNSTLPIKIYSANRKVWLGRENSRGRFRGLDSFGLFVPVKGNVDTTAHKANLENYMLPALWKQFGESPFLLKHVCAPCAKALDWR